MTTPQDGEPGRASGGRPEHRWHAMWHGIWRLKSRERNPSALRDHSYMPPRSLQRRSWPKAQGAQDSNPNRTRHSPNERTSRRTTSGPGTPRRRAGAAPSPSSDWWPANIFDSRTERAPGAGGRGIRRANASSCDWWALRGARSGHGRAFKKFAAAAGCPAGRRSNKRCARGRRAARGSAQSNYSRRHGEKGERGTDAGAARPRRDAPLATKVG